MDIGSFFVFTNLSSALSKIGESPITSGNFVLNGISVTILNVTLAQLMQQPLAINVHKSATAITNYTSCGMLSAR